MHTPLGPGVEFDLIRRVWQTLGSRQAATGDDCTFLTIGDEHLAITSDIAIEGTHFQRGWLAPEDIGWRAATACLSDVAAVAGAPVGVMVSIGMNPEWPDEWTAEVMGGVAEAAAAVGAKVLGGDLVRSATLVVDVCAIARAPAPTTRAGARVGDAVYITGALGGPAAALRAWTKHEEPDVEARARFVRPQARIEEAAWLKDAGAHAIIDVSDGILADAQHLASASGVRLVIDADRVPVHAAATPEDALVSGEEFELLLTLGAEDDGDVERRFGERFACGLTRVGVCESGEGLDLQREGRPVPVPSGFRHF